MYYIVYNPLSGNGQGNERTQVLKEILKDRRLEFIDIREVGDMTAFIASIGDEDGLVIAGGDGTLNRFINLTYDISYPKHFYYFAVGSGNDFRQDVDPN